MKKTLLSLILIAFFGISLNAQKINWLTLNKALELQKTNPKKIMVDVYTNWCGPCKMLDKQTFQNKDVAKYVNENFYAVKFNGEGNETITYKENKFSNPNYDPSKAKRRNSPHQFADYLGLRGYPTIAFFDEDANFLYPLTGFYKPNQLEFYLKLFVADKHKELKTKEQFQEYYNSFKPEFKVK
ncbi:thioredoxin family protein [Polaribacter porphyrae]|uniref:Thioredoxin family protein n=1 Tax=Polaribacter porphyrae TaxID=1137780 RepID=A0A2S7WT39_9FLAO|nr:thioredoxin family protein [Polaribacter porphyrae]PQJ80769.1 thioredoxin family protein [Polaribacter porphyrae]